jgi:hypothetical protein
MRVHQGVLAVLGACGTVLGAASPGDAQTVGYAGSLFVARSTFETEQVTSVYIFNGLDVTAGPIRVSASIPVIRQQATPLDSVTDPATVFAPRTSAGFGDPLIRLDVQVVDDWRHALQISVAGSVKPAIVDPADGLGTGVADYGVGVSAFKAMGGTVVIADAMFWEYGDPEGIDFENSLSYSLGVGRTIGTGRWSTLASFAGFSPIGDTPPPLLLTIGVMRLIGLNQSLAINATFGLTDTSSDFSIGTSWRIQK